MKKKILFALFFWVLLLTVGEAALRVYELVRSKPPSSITFNPASIFVPHPYSTYAANPDHHDHNTQGFRSDRDTPYQAAPGRTTIVCMGGSSTYGTRVSLEDSYPHQLGLALEDKPVRVINAGLAGYSTANIISVLSLRVLHLRPDVVVFYVGWNDAWNRLLFAGFEPDYLNAQQSWKMPDLSIWRHSRVVETVARRVFGRQLIRDPHIQLVAQRRHSGDPRENWRASTSAPFRTNLKTLVSIVKAHGAVPVLVTQATDFAGHALDSNNDIWVEAMKAYTKVIKEVAAERSIHLIDVRKKMSDQARYFADVLHMSEAGNRKRAELIAAYLARNGLSG